MAFKYRCLLSISPTIFLLDQLSKCWVIAHIPFGQAITIIPGYFDVVHVHNTGAAFGVFAGAHAAWREPFFYLISVIATGVIFSVLRTLSSRERLLPITLSLIFGGILGNLLDRIRLGYVTDFLSAHWRDVVVTWDVGGWRWNIPLEWPAFNVADSAITVSMILLAWYFLRGAPSDTASGARN